MWKGRARTWFCRCWPTVSLSLPLSVVAHSILHWFGSNRNLESITARNPHVDVAVNQMLVFYTCPCRRPKSLNFDMHVACLLMPANTRFYISKRDIKGLQAEDTFVAPIIFLIEGPHVLSTYIVFLSYTTNPWWVPECTSGACARRSASSGGCVSASCRIRMWWIWAWGRGKLLPISRAQRRRC